MTAATRRPTETECQATIIEAARYAGWLIHHTRPAINQSGRWSTPLSGHAGFPDLILAHPRGRLLIVELKRRPNRATTAQDEWLTTLRACGIDARLVWVPDQLDELLTELTTTT